MKKKSSIVKLSIVGFLIIIGILLSVLSFPVWNNKTFKGFARSIKLGLDLKGGIYAVYEASSETGVADFDSALSGTRTRLQDMLVNKGYTEAVVVIENNNRIRVEVPDVNNPQQIFSIIGQPVGIEFVLDESPDNAVLSGSDIKSAKAGYDNEGKPIVSLSLKTTQIGQEFGQMTENNVGKSMSIYRVVDGVRESDYISRANIQEAIYGGNVAITMSNGTYQDAVNLADQITSGTFALDLTLLVNESVDPSLGSNALFYSVIAGIIGLILVMAFMTWRYRMMGVVASITLLLYTVLFLFFLAVFPWVQLTLSGIAGILLSIGMAVDGNVIIYERIRDEYREGKSILASYYAGFKRALAPILDGNITTIIAAVVLLIFGGSSVRGFGFTLLIGIVLSVISSLVFTRFIFKWFLNINSTEAKYYNLKRGKGVTEIPDDDNDSEAEDAPVTGTLEGASATL